jgi:hypothetical protein
VKVCLRSFKAGRLSSAMTICCIESALCIANVTSTIQSSTLRLTATTQDI